MSRSSDGKTLASAGYDKTVRLWNLATRKQVSRLSGHTELVWDVAFSPDGNTLTTAGFDETVRLWDLATRKQLGRLSGHTDPVNGVAFSPDGKTLASAGYDKDSAVVGSRDAQAARPPQRPREPGRGGYRV